MGVTVEACTLELRRHSTGQPFATTELTQDGGIDISSGVSEHQRSGIFRVKNGEVLAKAVEKAVLGQDTDLLDVGAVATFTVKVSLGIPFSFETSVELTPEDLQQDSDDDNGCFVDPTLLAANITFERGTQTSLAAEIAGEARTGPCQPKWNFFQVHLPELQLHAVAKDIGEAVRFSLPAQSFDLKQPNLRVSGRLILEDSHVSGASAALKAVAGERSAVKMQLRASSGQSPTICVVQETLAELSLLVEAEISQSQSSTTSGTSPEDVISLQSVSGSLGGTGAAGNSATLQMTVSLATLLPDVTLVVSGTLPMAAFVIDVHRQTAGCPSTSPAAMLEVYTLPDALAGSEPLQLKIGASTAPAFGSALAAGTSAAALEGSSLTFRARVRDDSWVSNRVMSWWSQSWTAEIFNKSASSSPASTASHSASVVSTSESLRAQWLLSGLTDSGSVWTDAQISGSAALAAGDTAVGSVSVAAAPLKSGMDASLQIGGSSTPRTKAEVVQAIHPLLQELSEGKRPGSTAKGKGNLQIKIPGSLNATLGVDVNLWPDASAGNTGGQSPTTAKLIMSGSSQWKEQGMELSVLPSVSLLVDEAWGALAEGSLAATGVWEGTSVDLSLTVPSVFLSSMDLGIDACVTAEGGESDSWSAKQMRVAVLGGDKPGAPLKVPCFFADICTLDDGPALPVTGELSASLVGEVGILRLEQLSISISTAASVQVITGTPIERVAASASLWNGSTCSMQSGSFSCSARASIHEAAAADLVAGESWKAVVAPGANGDYLGDLLANIVIATSDDGTDTSSSVSGMSLLENMQLIRTSQQEMIFSLAYEVSKPLGVGISFLIGDVQVTGTYEGSVVLEGQCNIPELSGLGNTLLNINLGFLAANSTAKVSLENLIEVLISDVVRVTVPIVDVSGQLTSSRILGGGFALSMTLMVPDLYPDGGSTGQNELVPATDYTLFPLDMGFSLFGSGCPCINVEVKLLVTLYNPLWFDVNESDLKGTLYLKDPDGVSLLFLTAMDPDPSHLIDTFDKPEAHTMLGRKNTTITIPIDVGASSGWRIYDENSKDRLTFRLTNGSSKIAVKAPSSTEGFDMHVRFHIDSVTA